MLLQSRQVLLVRNMSELIHRLDQLQTKIDSLFNNEFCFSYFNPCLFYHSYKLKTDFFWWNHHYMHVILIITVQTPFAVNAFSLSQI